MRSSPTLGNGDDIGRECTTDWCDRYNNRDWFECEQKYAEKQMESSCLCFMSFVPAPCTTNPNTGCWVQDGQSTCDIECQAPCNDQSSSDIYEIKQEILRMIAELECELACELQCATPPCAEACKEEC